MSRRGLILFAAMGVIWGMPYLFIKEAVGSFSPGAVVAGRTLGGALLLLPIAAVQGALRPALAQWKWVVAFAAIEMAGPFMLLSHAEQTLPSGLTGLLVSTVPLVAAVIGFTRGDRGAMGAGRVLGLAVGIGGVALVVGGGGDGDVSAVGVIEVLLTAVCYAVAPIIIATRLRDVPALGSISLALAVVGVGYLPVALATQDGTPTGRSVAALVALAIVCTALAFVVFFALIGEIGPMKAPLITYVNPVVALGLGVAVLDERVTRLMLAGIPLILIGCWFAASGDQHSSADVPEPLPEGCPPLPALAAGD
jgi:drug/metabolite transporter (DMT)-like permease